MSRSVSVFVARRRGVFHAATLNIEAVDAHSSTVAVRRCAAEHFGVGEHMIELTPNGEHLVIAAVREPAAGRERGLRFAGAIAGLVGVACLWLLFRGGAR